MNFQTQESWPSILYSRILSEVNMSSITEKRDHATTSESEADEATNLAKESKPYGKHHIKKISMAFHQQRPFLYRGAINGLRCSA